MKAGSWKSKDQAEESAETPERERIRFEKTVEQGNLYLKTDVSRHNFAISEKHKANSLKWKENWNESPLFCLKKQKGNSLKWKENEINHHSECNKIQW